MTDNQTSGPTTPPALIDRSMKALIRRVPGAFFRLAGVDAGPLPIRYEDVSINLAEHRADQVIILGEDDDPERWASHLEYQLQPDARALRGWFFKREPGQPGFLFGALPGPVKEKPRRLGGPPGLSKGGKFFCIV